MKKGRQDRIAETLTHSPNINPKANTAVLPGRELKINPLCFITLNLRFKNNINFSFSKIRRGIQIPHCKFRLLFHKHKGLFIS